NGTTIVCIENEPAILDGMKTLLMGWDARVIAALEPTSAIEAIANTEERITGLLVDYHLDRGNGIGAIRDIRHRFGANIPAILI
uniref:response regulator n=1 Tax=Enterobacter hormaechei TaxID=158836 RepID=UPI0013D7F154